MLGSAQHVPYLANCHDGDEIPRDDEGEPLYEDFICQACAAICSFLTLYPETIWAPLRQRYARLGTSKESNELGDLQSACSSSPKLDKCICSSEPSEKDFSLINTDIEKTSGEKGASLGEMSEKSLGLEGNPSVDASSVCSSGKLENGSCSSHSVRKATEEGVLLVEIPMKTMGLKQCSRNPDASFKCILGVDL